MRRVLLVRRLAQQQDRVGVLLQLPALAEVVLRRRPLALGRRGDLAQPDHGHAGLLRQAVQAHADPRHDVPALRARAVDQLHVVDEDHVEAPRQCPSPDRLQRVRLPDDPEGHPVAHKSGPAGALKVRRRQSLVPACRQRDPCRLPVGHQSCRQALHVRLQTEESDALALGGHVPGELQGEGGLADAAVRAQDHELPGADPQDRVEFFDPPVQIVRLCLVLHPVDVLADQLADAPVLDVLGVAQRRADPFKGRRGFCLVLGVDDRQRFGLHGGEPGLLPADPEPGPDVRRGRRRHHGGPQQLLVVVPRRGQDGHRVQRLSLEPELPGALEDVPQLRVPEPVRLRALEDLAGRVFRVEQQAADHGLLGLLPGSVHSSHSTASFRGVAGGVWTSSSHRLWLSHLQG